MPTKIYAMHCDRMRDDAIEYQMRSAHHAKLAMTQMDLIIGFDFSNDQPFHVDAIIAKAHKHAIWHQRLAAEFNFNSQFAVMGYISAKSCGE